MPQDSNSSIAVDLSLSLKKACMLSWLTTQILLMHLVLVLNFGPFSKLTKLTA